MAATVRSNVGLSACTLRRCSRTRALGIGAPGLQGVVRTPAKALAQVRASADRDFFFSPFELMDREMARMDQQMDLMTRKLDQDLARMLDQTRRLEAEASKQVDEALGRVERGGIQIRRSEERGPGSYRFYESITISSSSRPYAVVTQAAAPAMGPSPWLVVAVLAAGIYAALAAAFARNVHLTTFKSARRWQLAALWPLLVLASARFREQFVAAIRGLRGSHQSRSPDTAGSADQLK